MAKMNFSAPFDFLDHISHQEYNCHSLCDIQVIRQRFD
jgi:hypothetical protein